jgi:hypothetical protein
MAKFEVIGSQYFQNGGTLLFGSITLTSAFNELSTRIGGAAHTLEARSPQREKARRRAAVEIDRLRVIWNHSYVELQDCIFA